MLRKIRQRIQSEESGFTLIELLVVVLIIGILAAIAIPAFLGQREKAQDSEAKSAVRNAQTAAEAYFTDSQTYNPMTKADLVAIEPSLGTANGFTVEDQSTTGYKLTVTSRSGGGARTFSITKAGSAVTRTCAPTGGGCTGSGW